MTLIIGFAYLVFQSSCCLDDKKPAQLAGFGRNQWTRAAIATRENAIRCERNTPTRRHYLLANNAEQREKNRGIPLANKDKKSRCVIGFLVKSDFDGV